MLIKKAEQSSVPVMRQVFGRIGRCLLAYLLLHAVAWVAITLLVPWEIPTARMVEVSLIMLALIGIPTLLLAILAGLGHRKMTPARFRGVLVVPMLVFIWPCLAGSTAEPLLVEFVAQLVFVCFLMPVPLLPAKWKG
ncbi:hypothetical protein ACIO87_33545 [Streptomyces sp. NPDC087218]|uniref:hypothetical protein n=1 Tax=Streptomyces sp. NPDC087218 TaxID=3365769 RepID=UPI00380D5884